MATERYHPLFAIDLANVCSHYDSIASILGNSFRTNVRSAIQHVVDRPDSFGRMVGDFRGALVDHIPYVFVFTSDDDVPSIYDLHHAASDRADWFRRTMTSPSG